MGFALYNEEKQDRKRRDIPLDLMHQLKCKTCPRNNADLINGKMLPTGASESKCLIYVFGEAPGEEEDKKGVQFIGKSGQYLRNNIPIEYEKNVRWNNTIRCRPPDNRNPLLQEIECCRPLQEEDIEKHKPNVIVGTGNIPLSWMLPGKTEGIYAWRARWIPVKIGNHICWYYPILHPAGVIRRSGSSEYKSDHEICFERDLENLFLALRDGLEPPCYVEAGFDERIICINKGDRKDVDRLERKLEKFSRARYSAFDYETVGLRPYRKESAIVTCSIAVNYETIAFPLMWPGFWKKKRYLTEVMDLLQWYLEHTKGTKVCHNSQFEQEWTGTFLSPDVVKNITWGDTQAMSYILDERKRMHSLNTLCRIEFGFDLKELTEVDVTDILKNDLQDVLVYNGMDSKWTLELFFGLKRRFKGEPKLRKALEERIRTGISSTLAQIEGVPVNKRTARNLQRKIHRSINSEKFKFHKQRPIKKFKKKIGRWPNVSSNPDMTVLFRDIMRVQECITDKGGVTTADKVLSALDFEKYPVAPIILELRSLDTIKGTFLDPILDPKRRLVYSDGKLHTNWNHLFTSTGRLSSDDPNLQNWPKQKWRIARKLIEALAGYKLLAADYAGIEARCIAMASEDEFLVKAFWDEYDIHGEWASIIYSMWQGALRALDLQDDFSDKEVFKAFRHIVKNRWVFPLFFGSSQRSVMAGMHMPEIIAEEGFGEFWSTFPGVKDWHKKVRNFYNDHGYVETLTGRRRHEPLGWNEIINSPIQGTAADICQNAGSRLSDEGIQFCLNVHDDLSFMRKEKTFDKDARKIAKAMCSIEYDFINVPLVVEMEAGPNWYELEEFDKFSSVDFGHEY